MFRDRAHAKADRGRKPQSNETRREIDADLTGDCERAGICDSRADLRHTRPSIEQESWTDADHHERRTGERSPNSAGWAVSPHNAPLPLKFLSPPSED